MIITVLTECGMTHAQARLYEAIFKYGPLSSRKMPAQAKIDLDDLPAVLRYLKDRSLVEKCKKKTETGAVVIRVTGKQQLKFFIKDQISYFQAAAEALRQHGPAIERIQDLMPSLYALDEQGPEVYVAILQSGEKDLNISQIQALVPSVDSQALKYYLQELTEKQLLTKRREKIEQNKKWIREVIYSPADPAKIQNDIVDKIKQLEYYIKNFDQWLVKRTGIGPKDPGVKPKMRMYYGDEGLVDFYENEIFTIDDGSEICEWQKESIEKVKYSARFKELEKRIFTMKAKWQIIAQFGKKHYVKLDEEYVKYNHVFRFVKPENMPLNGDMIIYKNCVAHIWYDENSDSNIMVYENSHMTDDMRFIFNNCWNNIFLK